MFELKRSKQFKKSYKRVSNSRGFPFESFNSIVDLFGIGVELPKQYHDHALKGNYVGLRECHISSDCLLIYEIDHENKYVRFVDIGNHSNLFE